VALKKIDENTIEETDIRGYCRLSSDHAENTPSLALTKKILKPSRNSGSARERCSPANAERSGRYIALFGNESWNAKKCGTRSPRHAAVSETVYGRGS
jgi:hypothetical protein